MSIKTTKVVEFEVDDLLVKYPMRRKVDALPTRKTPPPAESVVETTLGWPPFGSDEYWVALKHWHEVMNG